MVTQRTKGLHSLLILCQILGALLLYGALVLVFHTRGSLNLERYVLYGFVVALALAVESLRRDKLVIRTCLFERSLLKLHSPAMRQTVAVLIALVLLVTLLKDATLSRLFLITFLATLYPVLLLTNHRLPPWLARNIFRGVRTQKTLLVGSASKVPPLKKWLERKSAFGFVPVGILCDEEITESECGLPILGTTEDIERAIRDYSVSQVIVLGLPLVLQAYSQLIDVCNRRGVRLMILSDLEERLRHPAIHVEDDGLQFITLRQEPLENPLNRLMKRLLDLAVAIPVTILILPPVCVVVWVGQRLQSPGPLFYRQTRAGIQNMAFEIVKFRTMHPDNAEVAKQATNGDARVFPAGRWFRKLSIDELPQFLNVLVGEMSVVGPRPHLIEHNQQFAEVLAHYHIRAFVRPGITGLAQVRGYRGEAATVEAITARLEADMNYLENWSLLADVAIIARTAWQVMAPPNTAY